MKRQKLKISGELKSQLKEMLSILDDIPLDDEETSQITGGGGCGDHCMITCSWWCEKICAGSCDLTGMSEMGCAYKAVCPAAHVPVQ